MKQTFRSCLKHLYQLLRKVLAYLFTFEVKLKVAEFQNPLQINGRCKLTRNTHLGRNVNMNGLEIAGTGKVTIGDNFHSGPGCLLITENHNFNGERVPYDDISLLGEIVIEDNVWLGSRVIVLPGNRIGEGAIVQAGSVVVSDVPACAIAGGHPATVFSSRDKEKYFRLKELGQFL